MCVRVCEEECVLGHTGLTGVYVRGVHVTVSYKV